MRDGSDRTYIIVALIEVNLSQSDVSRRGETIELLLVAETHRLTQAGLSVL